MARKKKQYDEGDPSAESKRGAAIGGAAGAVAGAVIGAPLGPVMAAFGAVVGGAVGAVGTGVVVAAVDTAGEEGHTDKIQEQTDAAIEGNRIEDDTPMSVASSWVNEDVT